MTAEGCSETGLAMDSCNHVLWSEKFRKYLNYDAHIFFSESSKLYVDSENAIIYGQNVWFLR